MRISIKKCLYMVFWISIIQGFLSDYFGFGMINYLSDLLIAISIIIKLYIGNYKILRVKRLPKSISLCIVLFSVEVLVSWLVNGVSVLHALWGLRNNYRFFIYFLLCYSEFEKSDFVRIIKWMISLFPLHAIIMMYQIIIERLSYDYLGGLFGKETGCASGLMIYYGLIILILLSQYDSKLISFRKMMVFFLFILFSSAIAELKALYVYFVIVIVLYLLLSRNKVKASVVSFFALFGIFIGTELLAFYFPYYKNYFTIERILGKLVNFDSSYTHGQGLNIGRSSVFSKLDPILSSWGSSITRFIGLGLGNGDYSSSFPFLNSSFYNTYSLSHYMHFSLSFLFVETGYIGTICYVFFFVFLWIIGLKNYIDAKTNYRTLKVLIPVLCFFLIYYNCSLRTNFAFIVFSLLPLSLKKDI